MFPSLHISSTPNREYLAKRYHHELALLHVRMRQREVVRVKMYVVVHQYIYVDRAVVILPIHRLLCSAQLTFYLLCSQ